MNDICPVCGKGHGEPYYAPNRLDAVAITPVEHLDCVLKVLAERDELLAMLDKGGVRIVSAGGSFTLAEFRQGVADLKARAEEGSGT